MKLKNLIKYTDPVADYELKDHYGYQLYAGNKFDIPAKYLKWHLDNIGDREAEPECVYCTTKINKYGAKIDTFIIYIREEK